MKILADIADAVAAAINAAVAASYFGVGVNFTAVRAHLHEFDVAAYENMTVLVATSGFTKTPRTRGHYEWNVDIAVGTVKHVGANKDNATLDPLLEIAGKMATDDVLETRLTAAGLPAEWIGTVSNPHFDRSRLSEKNVFFNLAVYTYYAVRRR